MRPWSGLRKPVIRLKRVVLPAPLGPITALMIPGGTAKLTRCKARTPPKDRDTSFRPRRISLDRNSPSFLFIAAKFPQIQDAPHQPPGQKDYHYHQNGPENHHLIVMEEDQQLREHGEDRGPQQRAPDAGHAPYHHH